MRHNPPGSRVTPKINTLDAMELDGGVGRWLARWMELDGQPGRWFARWMELDGQPGKCSAEVDGPPRWHGYGPGSNTPGTAGAAARVPVLAPVALCSAECAPPSPLRCWSYACLYVFQQNTKALTKQDQRFPAVVISSQPEVLETRLKVLSIPTPHILSRRIIFSAGTRLHLAQV